MSEIIIMRPPGFIDHLKQLIKDVVQRDFVIVEIGSYQGESSELFAQAARVVICVDPWEMEYDENDGAGKTDMKAVEAAFDARMIRHNNVRKLKMTSVEAAKEMFASAMVGEIDMIYVDGCHTYDAVKADLEAWVPLIKTGGIIAGHDYWNMFPGVMAAVDEVVGKPIKVYGDSSWFKIKT